MLNILGRMSGIATNTASWFLKQEVWGCLYQKDRLGLLDKWAVHVGGGLTHRLSRADALMIKKTTWLPWLPESMRKMLQ